MSKLVAFVVAIAFVCSPTASIAKRSVAQCDTYHTFNVAQHYLGDRSGAPKVRSIGLEKNARVILACAQANKSAKNGLDVLTAAIQLRQAGELAKESDQLARARALVRESLATLNAIDGAGLPGYGQDMLATAIRTARWDLQGIWQRI